jgi:hypothetical protein
VGVEVVAGPGRKEDSGWIFAPVRELGCVSKSEMDGEMCTMEERGI